MHILRGNKTKSNNWKRSFLNLSSASAGETETERKREMGRAPCCDKANVKKGPWSPEEDTKLKEFIEKHGTGGNWIALPNKAGLKRCGKSCRLRWLNYLRPDIKHGEFSEVEDRIICSLFATIGSRWSIIASQLPGRTDNDIKNYWNTKLKKKLLGIPTPPPPSQSINKPLPQQNFFPSISQTPPPLEIAAAAPTQLVTSSQAVLPIIPQSNYILNTAALSATAPSCSSNLLQVPCDHHCQFMGGSNYINMMRFGSGSGSSSSAVEDENKLFLGGYCQEEVEYTYEEIKQLLISNSAGCNNNGSINSDLYTDGSLYKR